MLLLLLRPLDELKVHELFKAEVLVLKSVGFKISGEPQNFMIYDHFFNFTVE